MIAGSGVAKRKWERAVREHRAALSSYLLFAGAIRPEAWDRPLAEDRWSPADVTEHLALAYVAMLRELAGEGAMEPRVSPLRQTLFRWFLLPHMLFHRSMPRVRAPREMRPGPAEGGQQPALDRLRELGLQFEMRLAGDPGATVTHPYFGRLGRVSTVRFCALHIEHHHGRASAALTRAGEGGDPG